MGEQQEACSESYEPLWETFLALSRKEAALLAHWTALAEKQTLEESQEEAFMAELDELLREKERAIQAINGGAGSRPGEIFEEAQVLDGQIRKHLQTIRQGMTARLAGMRRKLEAAGCYRQRVRQWGGVFVDNRK